MTPITRTKIPWLGIIAVGLLLIAQVVPEKLVLGSALYLISIVLACCSIKFELDESKKPNILSGLVCILVSLFGVYLMQVWWPVGIVDAVVAIWTFFNVTELNLRDEIQEGGD